MQSCDAHKFETAIQLIGPDGKPKQSKVKMCGTIGQSDADWIRTLEDAVGKTQENTEMPRAAKEQIIAAVTLEIDRLRHPALQLPPGTDIATLSRPKPSLPAAPATAAVTRFWHVARAADRVERATPQSDRTWRNGRGGRGRG